jgi:hypothetical protein
MLGPIATPVDWKQTLNGFMNHYGGSQIPYILYNVYEDPANPGVWVMTPAIVDLNITIKKGVYSINQISDTITKQLNGFEYIDSKGNAYSETPSAKSVRSGNYTGNLLQNSGMAISLNHIKMLLIV